jgi:hypothetical protein
MHAQQPAPVDPPSAGDPAHAAFYAAAHARLSAALGDEARQVVLDSIIDLHRGRVRAQTGDSVTH